MRASSAPPPRPPTSAKPRTTPTPPRTASTRTSSPHSCRPRASATRSSSAWPPNKPRPCPTSRSSAAATIVWRRRLCPGEPTAAKRCPGNRATIFSRRRDNAKKLASPSPSAAAPRPPKVLLPSRTRQPGCRSPKMPTTTSDLLLLRVCRPGDLGKTTPTPRSTSGTLTIGISDTAAWGPRTDPSSEGRKKNPLPSFFLLDEPRRRR
mmetsp:Transcript_23138/g.71104  ORF Transcript_23138/g.71104 Transcript_23138/m.71104 type:complete len:207 (-) Transcript_23138:35-655(-)